MKSNHKMKVALFAACFAWLASIGDLSAQSSRIKSPVPPTDIPTSSRVQPPIISGTSAAKTDPVLSPLTPKMEQSNNPPPIVSGDLGSSVLKPMTPKIQTSVENPKPTDFQQAGAVQRATSRINQRLNRTVRSGRNGAIVNSPLPPIIQRDQPALPLMPATGQTVAPTANSGITTENQVSPSDIQSSESDSMAPMPNYVQASSPLPSFPVNSGAIRQETDLPFEAAQDIVQPRTPLQQNVLPPGGLIPEAMPRSVVDSGFAAGQIGQDYFDSSSVGCSSCGNAGCTSCVGNTTAGCSSCGPGGCFDCDLVDQRFAACGFISRARNYSIFDALYMTRSNGEVRALNLSAIDEFDYGFGGRFTIGQRNDAASGREFSYYGAFDIEESGTVTDGLGRIAPRFIPDGTFITPLALAPLTNIVTASESMETQFHSFEYNRVRWGWDVVKVLFGVRYVYLEDEYNASTVNAFAQTGSINVDSQNHMIGPQTGLELFYDVGYRWSLSGFGKFGLMLNAYDSDLNVSTNGFTLVDSGTNEADVSYLIDLGITAHYQLSTSSRFRVGYNLLYFDEVTTADEAFPAVLSPFSASSLDAEDDALFSGVSFGLEFYR